MGVVGAALVMGALVGGCGDNASGAPSERATPAGSKRHEPRLLPPPATDDVLRLLGPLKVGSEIQGRKIVAIYGVFDGSIWVLLEHGASLAYLELTRAGEGPAPPFSWPPYAVYVSARGPILEMELLTLAESLGEVVKANGHVPVPAGLQTFHRGARLPDPP